MKVYFGVEIDTWQSSASGFRFMINVSGIDIVPNLEFETERKAVNGAKKIINAFKLKHINT